jgi:hypothetical protein
MDVLSGLENLMNHKRQNTQSPMIMVKFGYFLGLKASQNTTLSNLNASITRERDAKSNKCCNFFTPGLLPAQPASSPQRMPNQWHCKQPRPPISSTLPTRPEALTSGEAAHDARAAQEPQAT